MLESAVLLHVVGYKRVSKYCTKTGIFLRQFHEPLAGVEFLHVLQSFAKTLTSRWQQVGHNLDWSTVNLTAWKIKPSLYWGNVKYSSKIDSKCSNTLVFNLPKSQTNMADPSRISKINLNKLLKWQSRTVLLLYI